MTEYEAREFCYQVDQRVIYNESDGIKRQGTNEKKSINNYRKMPQKFPPSLNPKFPIISHQLSLDGGRRVTEVRL